MSYMENLSAIRRGIICGAENAFDEEVSACIAAYEGDHRKQLSVLSKLKEDLLKVAEDVETRDMLNESLSTALLAVESSLLELSAERELAEARAGGEKRIVSLMQDASYNGNPSEFYKTHKAAFMEIMTDLYSKKEADEVIAQLLTELTHSKLTELAAAGETSAVREIGAEAVRLGHIIEGEYARYLCRAEKCASDNGRAWKPAPTGAYRLTAFERALQKAVLAFVRSGELSRENAINAGFELKFAEDGKLTKATVNFGDHSARAEDGRLIPVPASFWENMLAAVDLGRNKDYMQLCVAAFAEDKGRKALAVEYPGRLADLALAVGITADNPRMLYLAGYFEDALRKYKPADSADKRLALWQDAERYAVEGYWRRFGEADSGIRHTEYTSKAGGRDFERLNAYSLKEQGVELSCKSPKSAVGGAFYSAGCGYLVPPDFIAALADLNIFYLKVAMEGLSKEIINIPPAEAGGYAGNLGSKDEDAFYVALTVRRLIEEGRASGALPEKASAEDFRYAAEEIGRRFYGLEAIVAKKYAEEVLQPPTCCRGGVAGSASGASHRAR